MKTLIIALFTQLFAISFSFSQTQTNFPTQTTTINSNTSVQPIICQNSGDTARPQKDSLDSQMIGDDKSRGKVRVNEPDKKSPGLDEKKEQFKEYLEQRNSKRVV